MIPKVIITSLPVASFSYFQWFLLGLYQLEDMGKIMLKLDISPIDYFTLYICNSKFVAGIARRLEHKLFKVPRYNLKGKIIGENGIERTFAIDSKDSPFIFTVKDLVNCDYYFKNQCPIEISKKGFEIVEGIFLPWQDVKFERNDKPYDYILRRLAPEVLSLKYKIYPSMVGPRRLGWSCRKKVLYENYHNYIMCAKNDKTKILVAYFGSASYPRPDDEKKQSFDFDWEADLMAYLGVPYTHPNTKRAKAVSVVNEINDIDFICDGRLITDTSGETQKKQIVPLQGFCKYLSDFCYNLNVSGFRCSIPNRFIESFMVGTAIITDKLKVRWYLPFDSEVIETVAMGYEADENVKWEQFFCDLSNLRHRPGDIVQKEYEKKWSPSVYASYLIETVLSGQYSESI